MHTLVMLEVPRLDPRLQCTLHHDDVGTHGSPCRVCKRAFTVVRRRLTWHVAKAAAGRGFVPAHVKRQHGKITSQSAKRWLRLARPCLRMFQAMLQVLSACICLRWLRCCRHVIRWLCATCHCIDRGPAKRHETAAAMTTCGFDCCTAACCACASTSALAL
jgi:hypothetical protein